MKTANFEDGVLTTGLILAIVMTGVGMVLNIIAGLDIKVDLFFIFCWTFTLVYRKKFKWALPLAFLMLVFGLLPIDWLSAGGTEGPMPYYSIVFAGIICASTRSWERRFLIVSLFIMEIGMVLYESYIKSDFLGTFYLEFWLHLAILTLVMVLFVTKYSNSYRDEQAKNLRFTKAIEEQNKQQIHYLSKLEDLNLQLRSERHDYNNQLGVIYGLVQIEDMQEIDAYVSKLVKTAEQFNKHLDIPYTSLGALINFKVSSAEEAGIRFIVSASIPDGLNIDEYEACVILGNLIDNSIEAQKSVDESERYINLSLNFEPDYLIIKIDNPYEHKIEKVKNHYRSTKNDRDNHGYGLSNVKEIMEKNNGIINISDEGKVFRVELAILCQ